MLTISLSLMKLSTLSAVSKTKAKDITGHGIHQVSAKLSGYVWIGSQTKLVHIPEDQADDVVMHDVEIEDKDEMDKTARELPNLEVKIEEEEHEPQQVQDDQQEDAGSRQGEEVSVEPGDSSQLERPEFPKAWQFHHVQIHSSRISQDSSVGF